MLTPIRTDSIIAPHGFFTRAGGVSTGRYEGLNCGPGSEDATDAVTENRARVTATLGADCLVSVHQVHSAEATHVNGLHQGERPKLDGMATATRGVALGALHADCAPVLFEDATANIVGAALSVEEGRALVSRGRHEAALRDHSTQRKSGRTTAHHPQCCHCEAAPHREKA